MIILFIKELHPQHKRKFEETEDSKELISYIDDSEKNNDATNEISLLNLNSSLDGVCNLRSIEAIEKKTTGNLYYLENAHKSRKESAKKKFNSIKQINIKQKLSDSLGSLNDKYLNKFASVDDRKKQKIKILKEKYNHNDQNLIDIYQKTKKLDKENSCLLEMIKDMSNVKWSSVDIGHIDPVKKELNSNSSSKLSMITRNKQLQFNESNLSEINLKRDDLVKSSRSILIRNDSRPPNIGAARSFSSDYRFRNSSRGNSLVGILRNPVLSATASTSTPTSRSSSRSGSVKIINILGKEIIKLPVTLEREIKIKKNFDQFGIMNVDCQIDEGVNGCVILNIEPNSACAKDKRLSVGDYLLSVNNEQMRNLTNSSVKGILKRASLTSSDVV